MKRDAEALRAHIGGMTYQQIADQNGWKSIAAAHQAVQRALNDITRLPRAEAIKAEEERLDFLTRTLTRLVAAPGQDPQVIVSAAMALLRVSESRRKMAGWDAPARTRVEVVPEEAVDRRIDQLRTRRLELVAAPEPNGNGNGHGPADHRSTG